MSESRKLGESEMRRVPYAVHCTSAMMRRVMGVSGAKSSLPVSSGLTPRHTIRDSILDSRVPIRLSQYGAIAQGQYTYSLSISGIMYVTFRLMLANKMPQCIDKLGVNGSTGISFHLTSQYVYIN